MPSYCSRARPFFVRCRCRCWWTVERDVWNEPLPLLLLLRLLLPLPLLLPLLLQVGWQLCQRRLWTRLRAGLREPCETSGTV